MASCQKTQAENQTNHRELAEIIGEYAVKEIRYQSGRLIGRHGFRSCDQDSIEAELAVRVWQDLRNYDRRKSGRKHFISEVIRRKTVELIRHREAEKRSFRREERSLDAPGEKLINEIAAADTTTILDCSMDVNEAISKLPEDLHCICLLLKEHSPAEAIRESGLTRAVLRGRMHRIREAFLKKNLQHYLD